MIKNVTQEQAETMKMNVYLKDGREFLGCDIPPKPFGETENIVTFWVDESIYIVPMAQVREAVFIL